MRQELASARVKLREEVDKIEDAKRHASQLERSLYQYRRLHESDQPPEMQPENHHAPPRTESLAVANILDAVATALHAANEKVVATFRRAESQIIRSQHAAQSEGIAQAGLHHEVTRQQSRGDGRPLPPQRRWADGDEPHEPRSQLIRVDAVV